MVTVAVIGLGYVGLPLVVEFGKKVRPSASTFSLKRSTNAASASTLRAKYPASEMKLAVYAEYSSDAAVLKEADFILVAVPTPVDDAHIPTSGRCLVRASRSGRT
jgi:UDP-N-acetyl-D-galactosamine dehydrogenase